MKIREGFVSNSSSTSFIVALEKMFASVDECLAFFECYYEQAQRIFEQLNIHTYVSNDPGTREIIRTVFTEYGQESYISSQLTDIFVENNLGKCLGVLTFSDEEGSMVDTDLRYNFRKMLQYKKVPHLVVRN